MTIPRRTDVSTGERTAAPGPTVLAELPHVGDPAIVPRSPTSRDPETLTTSTPSRKSVHPAFAQLHEPDDVEDFVDEPRNSRSNRRQTRYFDQPHIDDDWDDQEEAKHQAPRRKRPNSNSRIDERGRSSRPARQQGSGWRGMLSSAHARLAPFSGMIVTAALLAAGALLFFISSGGHQSDSDLDQFALPGFRVQAKDQLNRTESIESVPMADSHLSSTPNDTLDFGESTIGDRSSLAPADVNAAIPQPVIDEIVEPTDPLGSLSFPVTNMPFALDYKKAMPDPSEDLRALPSVAERDTLQGSEPISR